MTRYTLQREELLALLDQVGVNNALGMDSAFLSPLAAGETLSGRDFDSEEIALAQVLAHPHNVVRTRRFDAEDTVREEVWFYAAGVHFASLAAADGRYVLTALASLESLIDKANSMLPLRAGPDSVQYRVMLNQDDFIDVRYLLTHWKEVSAETILEASGMETFEAIDLAHSIESQEWHGRFTFISFKDDQLVSERELRILQGTDISWLGYLDPESGKMVIQSATNEVLDDISLRMWAALDTS